MKRKTRTLIDTVLAVFSVANAAFPSHAQPPLRDRNATIRFHIQQVRNAWAARLKSGKPATAAPPAIISGKLIKSTIDAHTPPASPSLSFKFDSPGGFLAADFQFENATGQDLDLSYYGPTFAKSGSYTIEDPGTVGQYAAQGTYTLIYAEIDDLDGQYVAYSASELGSIFPDLNITVTNSTPDTTSPTISAGKILTPTVSLSSPTPYFRAKLTVADTVSGVFYGYIVAEDPDGNEYAFYNYAPSPIKTSASLQIADTFNPAPTTTGTYTISEVDLVDYANNYTQITDQTALQSLFGTTTFKVTN
jgi:hypothetical protein